jgi:hypothetical protein
VKTCQHSLPPKSTRDFLLFGFAVTSAIFASLHRLGGRPISPATTPVPLRKNRARHERQWDWPQQRRASVCGSAAALRYGSVPAVSPLSAPLFPLADRRPKPEFAQLRIEVQILLSMSQKLGSFCDS